MSVLFPSGVTGATSPVIQDKTKFTKQVPENIQAQLDELWKTARADQTGTITANPVTDIGTAEKTAEILARHYTTADAGARTRTDTQIIAQADIPEAAAAVEKFMELTGSGKSHQERMYARILAALGLTEEDLQAMSQEEREKIEAKIKDMIKRETETAINESIEKSTAAEMRPIGEPDPLTGNPHREKEPPAI